MSTSFAEILIRHNLIPLPASSSNPANLSVTVTLLNNLSYYGYALSEAAYEQLISVSATDLGIWWQSVEPALLKLTGADQNIAEYVVYKNFPQEVLAMSEAEYWLKQILMYWGFPNQYFTQTPTKKPELKEKIDFRVLQPAKSDSLPQIFTEVLYLPNRWTEEQKETISCLVPQFSDMTDTAKIPYKENLVTLLTICLESDKPVRVNSATDVLRLAVALSEGDISLSTSCKLKSFSRSVRKFLLKLLDNCPNLQEDIWRRKNLWKKLFYALHPGDYAEKYPRVVAAYDRLYRNLPVTTFNSQLEALLEAKDTQALSLLQSRPGEFSRRLHACVDRFGETAASSFIEIIPQLQTIQLLKLEKYLETINDRLYRTIAPRGNWTKMQILHNSSDRQIPKQIQTKLLQAIAQEIKSRVSRLVPSVRLDSRTELIKLQTNDSDLTSYGRGTVFPIPENIRFIRSASYWRSGLTYHNIWYDNGWNFFQSDWSPLGTCCWDYERFGNNSAIFSGDPTNSKDLEGNAAQLIDLYLNKLRNQKVRYAVWNILCFSHVSFDEADTVYAALQWGEDPQSGKLFEPSRCQLSFPLTGKNFTKYIALLDLKENYLIYLDANLYARVNSANANLVRLQQNMPAFLEYLNTLPGVYDLFKHQPQTESGLCVAYSDENLTLEEEEAYVFRPSNRDNQFTQFSLTPLLS